MHNNNKRIARIYDFDLTLSEEFQQYPIFRHFFDKLKETYQLEHIYDYWNRCKDSDSGISWMELFLKDSKLIFDNLTNERMEKEFGPQIRLSPGIPQWFERIRDYSNSQGLESEDHVVSVGIDSLIRGTSVYHFIDSLQSGVYHDDKGIYKIKTVINPFQKVHCVKKICKGENNNLHDDLSLNEYNVNYKNVIIYGDGQSDKDAFRFVRQRGGIAIAVFEENNKEEYQKALGDLGESVNAIVPRNWGERSILERVTREFIHDMATSRCDFDFDLIHKNSLGQLYNSDIIKITKNHYSNCKSCQKKSKLLSYFN